jgi:uncharacterized protein (DUF2236 family)
MQIVRRAIRDQVHGLVGARASGVAPPPRRDDGLFGPGSAAWRVHGDFTSMMIGGVASLLLQMLHPGALAGVWDHSNFRRDMAGRLRRTAQFISGTTYGSTDQALALIARVRGVHDRVRGELPDGRAYSANDPDLLEWVHVAGALCFVRSHVRYRDPDFSAEDQDRYFAETAVIAYELGAVSAPTTRQDAEAYLEAMRPQLRWDNRTRIVAGELLSQSGSTPSLGPIHGILRNAAVDLLPVWAADLHGFDLPPRRRPLVRAGAAGVGAVVRWAMREGAATAKAQKTPARGRQGE